MSNEELCRKIRAGERDKLLELWQQVQRFAWQQSRRWIGAGGMDAGDLMQVAFLATLDAVERWEVNRGAFITCYAISLKRNLTEAAGQRTQRERKDPLQDYTSLDAPITDCDGDPIYLCDVLPDPAAEKPFHDIEKREQAAAVRHAVDSLPEEQRRAIIERYWLGGRADTTAALRTLRRPEVRKQFAMR